MRHYAIVWNQLCNLTQNVQNVPNVISLLRKYEYHIHIFVNHIQAMWVALITARGFQEFFCYSEPATKCNPILSFLYGNTRNNHCEVL